MHQEWYKRKESIKLDTIGWGRWSTGKCASFKFDHMKKWYIDNPESVRENETPKILWDFEIQTDHLISARLPDLVLVNPPPKKTWRILTKSEKNDKYQDLARERKKNLWNMKGTVILIEIGALGTITKGLVQGQEDLEIMERVEPSCWDLPEYWEESWRFEKTCCHSDYGEKTSANAGVKISQRRNNNNNNWKRNLNLTIRTNGIWTTQHLS